MKTGIDDITQHLDLETTYDLLQQADVLTTGESIIKDSYNNAVNNGCINPELMSLDTFRRIFFIPINTHSDKQRYLYRLQPKTINELLTILQDGICSDG